MAWYACASTCALGTVHDSGGAHGSEGIPPTHVSWAGGVVGSHVISSRAGAADARHAMTGAAPSWCSSQSSEVGDGRLGGDGRRGVVRGGIAGSRLGGPVLEPACPGGVRA